MKAFGCTHTGPRPHNEDSYGILELDDALLLIVADGLGGHNAGEVASNLSVKVIKDNITEHFGSSDDIREILTKAIEKANTEIFDLANANQEYSGMGTTVVAAIIYEGRGIIANVGDSRAYYINDFEIKQVTKDNSLVQSLLDMGAIDEGEVLSHPQKNVVLKSLGMKESVDVDFYEVYLDSKSILLLCSDGLSDTLLDNKIKEVILENETLEQTAKELIGTSLKMEGNDNITVVLCQ